MKTRLTRWLMGLVAGIACGRALIGVGMAAPPRTVPKWSVHEIAWTAVGRYANPCQEVNLRATFQGPAGVRQTVSGFWDGANTFKLRFTPTAEGRWTYTTASNDAGLNGKRGELICTAPKPGSHGFIRRDAAHPYHFVYDDGTRYFMLGQTYYNLLGSMAGRQGYRTAVDSSRAWGMNKIRMHVNGALSEGLSQTGIVQGVPGEFEVPNVAHFQHVDSVIQYLNSRNVVADLILMPRRLLGTPEQEHQYLDYLVARYAAFPNVIWCLINEWNYAKRPKEFYTRAGQRVRQSDPWAHQNGQPRLLSVHQQTRIDFQFFAEDWLSHAIVQFGVRNRQKTSSDEWNAKGRAGYRHGDAWGRASIRHNWGYRIPVVNDEYGYIGEPKDVSETDTAVLTRQKHRQILWGIVTAGGYASAGDKTAYPGQGKPYFEGFWHPTPEYGDIRRLVNFFTQPELTYWTMSPDTLTVTNGNRVYCLSEPARQYVVYAAAGGTFGLRLPAGTYQVTRLDPATGQRRDESRVASVEPLNFSLPPGPDAVLFLRRKTETRVPSMRHLP
jgi:hypothetical protein